MLFVDAGEPRILVLCDLPCGPSPPLHEIRRNPLFGRGECIRFRGGHLEGNRIRIDVELYPVVAGRQIEGVQGGALGQSCHGGKIRCGGGGVKLRQHPKPQLGIRSHARLQVSEAAQGPRLDAAQLGGVGPDIQARLEEEKSVALLPERALLRVAAVKPSCEALGS